MFETLSPKTTDFVFWKQLIFEIFEVIRHNWRVNQHFMVCLEYT